jgi:pimeloyl-ACP methyl ester carboxylesterase
VTLNHHRSGSGEPVLMVHGIGSQWQVWSPMIERLEGERELIAVDLPGFGGSDALPDGVEPTPDALADSLVAFLDEIGLERPLVVGNSLGGLLTLELARRGRARAAVAICPSGFALPRERRYATRRFKLEVPMARRIVRRAPELVRNPIARTPLFAGFMAYPWRVPPDEAVEMFRNLASSPGFDATLDGLSEFTFRDGQEIDVPVTIVWGTRDFLLLPRQAARAGRVIPGARVIRVPRAGHVPTYDQPDELARIVREA